MSRAVRRAAVLLLASTLLAGLDRPAGAALVQAQLDEVSISPAPGAALALPTPLADIDRGPTTLGSALGGHPAVLVFADYTCRFLCGTVLALTTSALDASGLDPAGYRLVLVGLDPKDSAADARAMVDAEAGQGPSRASLRVLCGDGAAVRSLTGAAGYHAVYDAEHDQYAHPAGVIVLSADGHVAHVLSGIGLTAGDLRLALVEAGHGTTGGLIDQLRLLCYGFDAVHGLYTSRILMWLQAAGLVTVAALGALLLWLSGVVRPRRRA